jgi:hypothetical protein
MLPILKNNADGSLTLYIGILSFSYGHVKTASAERSMMIPLRDTMVDGESMLSFLQKTQARLCRQRRC